MVAHHQQRVEEAPEGGGVLTHQLAPQPLRRGHHERSGPQAGAGGPHGVADGGGEVGDDGDAVVVPGGAVVAVDPPGGVRRRGAVGQAQARPVFEVGQGARVVGALAGAGAGAQLQLPVQRPAEEVEDEAVEIGGGGQLGAVPDEGPVVAVVGGYRALVPLRPLPGAAVGVHRAQVGRAHVGEVLVGEQPGTRPEARDAADHPQAVRPGGGRELGGDAGRLGDDGVQPGAGQSGEPLRCLRRRVEQIGRSHDRHLLGSRVSLGCPEQTWKETFEHFIRLQQSSRSLKYHP